MRRSLLLTPLAALALLATTALAGDARPTREQIQAAKDQAFTEADADGNGTLSPDEFQAFHEALRRMFEQHRFQQMDTNGDGQISKDELDAARPPRHRGCPGPGGG